MADDDGSLFAAFTRKPTAAFGVKHQRFFPAQTICFGIERSAADGFPGHEPVKGKPRVVAGHSCCICARPHGNVQIEHSPNRRSPFRRLTAIAVQEILSLEGHAVLDRNAPSQRFDTFEAAVRDGFAMIEEPIGSFERDFTVDLLEHVQHPGDAFVIGGVNTERPFICSQERNNLLQVLFQVGRKVGSGFQEILEIRR